MIRRRRRGHRRTCRFSQLLEGPFQVFRLAALLDLDSAGDIKVILPGVVSHSTNVAEHPELVAERIVRFADAAGRENVIASTDCGLGGRVHPQIAWAKLDALVRGAELATTQLWG